MPFELETLHEYTDEALLAELKRVAAELQGERLTHDRFNARSRVHSSTLRVRFGSWRKALDLAGISDTVAPRRRVLNREVALDAIRQFVAQNPQAPLTRDAIAAQLKVDPGTLTKNVGRWDSLLFELGVQPTPLGRRYTDDECYENILALWTHFGRQPHFAELNRPPSTVGAKAYVRRWGGWRNALAGFVERANAAEGQPSSPSKPDMRESAAVVSIAAPLPGPRSLSLSLRYKVLCRDRFRCITCGASPAKSPGVELHVDHIVPWSRGGQNVEANLRTLCHKCNLGKGAALEHTATPLGGHER